MTSNAPANMLATRRCRSTSDSTSGLQLNQAEWPAYSEDELARHFALFRQYDLDSSGFISPANLLDVLRAMEVADADEAMVRNIIEEVALLSGHANDGQLSFRDYMHAIEWDRTADVHNRHLDARLERLSLSQEVGESVAEEAVATGAVGGTFSGDACEPVTQAIPACEQRARSTSLSVVNSIASARIKAFQQQVERAQAMASVESKLRPFQYAGPIVNQEGMHKETLANKVKAFEMAAKFEGKVEMKRTWRRAHGVGNYNPGQKLMLQGMPAKPPPKKKLSELP